MSIRRFVRGTVPWDSLEAVSREVADRYDEDEVRVSFLDADNWLSTPCVVNDQYFVKVVSGQNALVHALFTGARNLGAFSSGREGFFEPFDGPVEMAEHELEATEKLRDIGVNAPEPVESFEVDGHGVLVLEYLPEFAPLDQLDEADVAGYAPALFDALSEMHANDVAHGDLRGENVLVYDEDLYFIDATNVASDGIAEARAYDLASALAALEPIVGAQTAVEAVVENYEVDRGASHGGTSDAGASDGGTSDGGASDGGTSDGGATGDDDTDDGGDGDGGEDGDLESAAAALLRAQDFLGFIQMRPDHAFDAAALKGEIEKAASADEDATR